MSSHSQHSPNTPAVPAPDCGRDESAPATALASPSTAGYAEAVAARSVPSVPSVPVAGRSGANGSPLSVADRAFGLLTTGPDPLSLPLSELYPDNPATGSGAGVLPAARDGVLAVDRVRALLRHPDTAVEVKNAAWSALVARSQRPGGAWTVTAVGVALPSLVRLASSLATGPTTPDAEEAGGGRPVTRLVGEARAELDAEVLGGFLTELARVDATRRALFPHLLRAARRAGVAWLRRQRAADHLATAGRRGWMPPPPPAGHPDLVLARAIAAGVLSAGEAALIGGTRLEGRPVTAVAAATGVSVEALWKRRRRAEARLVAWLTDPANPASVHATPTATDIGGIDGDPTGDEVLRTLTVPTQPPPPGRGRRRRLAAGPGAVADCQRAVADGQGAVEGSGSGRRGSGPVSVPGGPSYRGGSDSPASTAAEPPAAAADAGCAASATRAA